MSTLTPYRAAINFYKIFISNFWIHFSNPIIHDLLKFSALTSFAIIIYVL